MKIRTCSTALALAILSCSGLAVAGDLQFDQAKQFEVQPCTAIEAGPLPNQTENSVVEPSRVDVAVEQDMPSNALSFAKLAHDKGSHRLSAGIGGYDYQLRYHGETLGTTGSNFFFSASYGYCLFTNLEMGISVGVSSIGKSHGSGWFEADDSIIGRELSFEVDIVDAQGFLKYYFTNRSRLVPYVGIEVGGSAYSINVLGVHIPDACATVGGMVGIEVMLNRSLSIDVEFSLVGTGEDRFSMSALRTQGLAAINFHF